jgi:hypothetical protein
MLGSTIGFVIMAAGERCIVANVDALVAVSVEALPSFAVRLLLCLPLKAGARCRGRFWARLVACDGVVRHRRSGAALYADLCRRRADDLPNALLADIWKSCA